VTGFVLEGDGLSATHAGGVAALGGVSLGLAAGEALAVVGRSGCGKTTLGRLLAGLPPPGALVAGRLRWPGGEAPVAGARRRGLSRHVAWLPQEGIAALHPQLTIGAMLAETLRAAGREPSAAAIAAALAEVGLPAEHAARHPHRLSGGQGQRVALACALAQGAAVLVADEPTSALDAGTAAALLRVMRARRERGLALLLVTHDLGLAAGCDRCLVLDGGVVVEEGAAARLLAAPASAAARALVAAHERLQELARCSARAA
jgi:ABC-type glutathione transport system ATPase component